MAEIIPFRALRYDPHQVRLEEVVTQPYDKITEEMQSRYYELSAHNLVRIILGRRGQTDTPAFNEYTRAAEYLHDWRAGGILLQFLPQAPERARQADLDPGDAPEGTPLHVVAEDDAWVEGRSLFSTVEDVELIDPAVSAERLLYRLFHERGVRVFRSRALTAECSCSRQGVANMLASFSQEDRDHMVKDGVITVTCEFCSSTYVFEPGAVGAAREAG